MRTSRTRTAQSPRFPQPVSSHNPQACAPAAPPPARPCQPTKCHSTLQATQTFGPSVTSHTHASMIAFHMAWHGVRVRTVAVHPLQADTPRLQPCGPSRRLTVRLSRLEQIESLLWRTASSLLNLAQLHLVMNGYVEALHASQLLGGRRDDLLALAALSRHQLRLVVHPAGFCAPCDANVDRVDELVARPSASSFDTAAARAIERVLLGWSCLEENLKAPSPLAR